MRIAFVDPIGWDYSVETAYRRPLGGSQSALCYLAQSLARRGHEVFTITGTTRPGRQRNVVCLSFPEAEGTALGRLGLDFCVILNTPGAAAWCRARFGRRTRLIVWTQHAADQPAVQPLADRAAIDAHDAFVFVSQWQRQQYLERFGIPLERTAVHRNAVAPAFERLFPDETPVRSAKASPPVLAYTSTPFRGLDVLVEVFPRIRRDVPGATLKVFSSMQVYQVQPVQDTLQFGWLYRACRDIEGVQYVGSVSQPELAHQLRSIAALAYPNTFAETSCITVMEAMAAGCWVVTSRLGALPETTAGFGQLVPLARSRQAYLDQFHRAVVDLLHRYSEPSRRDEMERQLQRQTAFVNNQYTWSRRAEQWESWLSQL